MKKIILGATLLFATGLSAQTYFEEDFSGNLTDQWTLHDEDGDGNNWGTPNAGVARSDSYLNSGGPLTPDNWMVTEAIDLTSATGGVYLIWDVKAVDQNWPDENYAVYVNTSDDVSTMETDGYEFTEIIGATGDFVSRAIDVSSYAGQTIHIAFRHYDCTNQFAINIDNVNVIENDVANDLELTSIDVDRNLVGDRTFNINVTNLGVDEINSFDVEWSYDGGAVNTENVTGLTLTYMQSHTVEININGVPAETKTFEAEITTSDEDLTNNQKTESYTFYYPVPQYVATDSDGNSFDLHEHLQDGQAIILDFMASWCGPCQSSTPEISQFIENNGSGNGNVQALAISVEGSDNASVLNGLNWNGGYYEYPKFPYTAENNFQYSHYADNHGFNSGGSIPFFVMICPDVNNPEMSTIVKHDVGFASGMFNSYETALDACPTATVDLIELPKEEINFNLYPNPATEKVNVDFELQNKNNVTVSVLNTVGQTVVSKNIKEAAGTQNVQFDTSGLEAGMYLVKVKTKNSEQVKRVSVVK